MGGKRQLKMGKSNFGKHFGYMDQLVAKLNKLLLEDTKLDPFIMVNKGLLEEIVSTHKRIKSDREFMENKFDKELREKLREDPLIESLKDVPKGYQPVFSDLDPRKPPQGGSGVPPKE